MAATNAMPDESPKVKCAECGFLALRSWGSMLLVESPDHFRSSGNRPTTPSGELIYAKGVPPVCFVRAVDLPGTIGHPPTDDRIKEVIDEPRACDRFAPWQQGFSPKEHQEMVNERAMLEWQREREEADRAWQATQAAQDHKWRQEDAKAANRRHNQSLIVAIVGIIAAALATLWAVK